MDCFDTYFTHAQTCDDVHVQSATQWTASVHTLHMLKPVTTCSTPDSGTMSFSLCIDTTKTFEKHSGEAKQRFASFFQFQGHYIKTEKHEIAL